MNKKMYGNIFYMHPLNVENTDSKGGGKMSL